MDVKRLLLLIPLAVLAYLLVVQWNQDYGQVAPEPEAPAFTTPAPGEETVVPGDEGLTVPAAPRAEGDLGEEIAADPARATATRDLVAVVTDVLDVRIDPQGGDIIYAALPQHRMTLDSDRPYVLLSDNETRSYVARSGLQLDGHSGRIAFTPANTSYRLTDGDSRLEVDLTAEIDGVDVIKRFTFHRGSYAVDVSYYLANNTDEPVTARFIGQLARDNSPDPSSGVAMGMSSYLGAAYSSPDERYQKVGFDDIQRGRFNNRDVQGAGSPSSSTTSSRPGPRPRTSRTCNMPPPTRATATWPPSPAR